MHFSVTVDGTKIWCTRILPAAAVRSFTIFQFNFQSSLVSIFIFLLLPIFLLVVLRLCSLLFFFPFFCLQFAIYLCMAVSLGVSVCSLTLDALPDVCCLKHIYFHHLHSTCSSIHKFFMDVMRCPVDADVGLPPLLQQWAAVQPLFCMVAER